ncbi:MAG: chemotaxis response regulator protein-glutamate methylesterase [Fimbriimonadaceae bacterium]
MKKQRILVVDDSPFVRRMLIDWIGEQPDMEVVGFGKNGEEGVNLARELRPDLVTLDVEMPVMTGLEALPGLLESGAKVLMVSSVTQQGAIATLQALEMGAFDFVTKPNNATSLKFVECKTETLDKIRAARYIRGSAQKSPIIPVSRPKTKTDRVILIASSTGGPSTLRTLWEALPVGFPAPIVIVQHMPPGFTASLAKRLDSTGTVPCREAVNGDPLIPGQGYIAPAGQHIVLDPQLHLRMTDEEKVHGVKPAADFLFESGAKYLGSRAVGVVLTGMGRDGAAGAVALRKAGATVIGEAESSCVIYGMPKAAKEAGGISMECELNEMAAAIVANLTGRAARAS